MVGTFCDLNLDNYYIKGGTMNKKLISLMIVTMCCSFVLFAESKCDFIPQLSVQGIGKISVTADQLEVSIGVKTTGATVKDVMNQNTEKMNAVKEKLNEIGIIDNEYKTAGFNLMPVWSYPPKKYDPSYKRKIIGYSVANAYRVKTEKLNLAGKIIAECARVGANDIGNINFSVARPQKYRAEAIQLAVKNATEDADALASAAKQKIIKVLNISLNNFYVPVARMSNQMYLAEGASARVQSVPVTPGEISIEVTVSVIFEISPKI
jgi:uncharacterized protein